MKIKNINEYFSTNESNGLEPSRIKSSKNVKKGTYKSNYEDKVQANKLYNEFGDEDSDDENEEYGIPQAAIDLIEKMLVPPHEIYLPFFHMMKAAKKDGKINIRDFHTRKLLDDKTIKLSKKFLKTRDVNDMFDQKTQDVIDDSLKNLMRTYIPIYLDDHLWGTKYMPLMKKVGVYDFVINKTFLNDFDAWL